MTRFTITFTAAEITDETTAIDAIGTINDPKVAHLSNKDRHDLRKMGPKSQGYVNNLYDIGFNHPEIIPDTFSIVTFKNDRDAIITLNNFRNLLSGKVEVIDDTIMQLGNNNMGDADAVYGFLKSNAKTNATLKALLDTIADPKKHSHTLAEEFTVPPASSVYKDGLTKEMRFSNHGITVFTINQDHLSTGGVNVA